MIQSFKETYHEIVIPILGYIKEYYHEMIVAIRDDVKECVSEIVNYFNV